MKNTCIPEDRPTVEGDILQKFTCVSPRNSVRRLTGRKCMRWKQCCQCDTCGLETTSQPQGSTKKELEQFPLEDCRAEEEEVSEDVEGRHVPVPRAPREPSRAEREEHNLTHLPYRSWCPFCVAGKAHSAPHKLSESEENGYLA